MDQVLGNWSPHSGGRPPSPAPLGRGPKAGYDNPRFPTIGPKDVKAPVGGYQSVISTAPPLDMGQLKRISLQRAIHYEGLNHTQEHRALSDAHYASQIGHIINQKLR